MPTNAMIGVARMKFQHFESSLNESALALFLRPDNPIQSLRTVFAPIGGNVSVNDLASISPSFLGETPFDDSLEYIVVREGAWGWIRVWSKPGGELTPDNPSCTFNLTTPAII